MNRVSGGSAARVRDTAARCASRGPPAHPAVGIQGSTADNGRWASEIPSPESAKAGASGPRCPSAKQNVSKANAPSPAPVGAARQRLSAIRGGGPEIAARPGTEPLISHPHLFPLAGTANVGWWWRPKRLTRPGYSCDDDVIQCKVVGCSLLAQKSWRDQHRSITSVGAACVFTQRRCRPGLRTTRQKRWSSKQNGAAYRRNDNAETSPL